MKRKLGGNKLEILKTILVIVYWIICIGIIILTLMQSKKDAGASGAIMGGSSSDSSSSSSSFYEKNKGRTKEGKLKRWTIILGITFALLAIGIGIMYMMLYT